MSDPREDIFPRVAEALAPGGWRHRVSHRGVEFVKFEPVKNGGFELVLRFDRKRLHWPPAGLVNIVKGDPDDFPWHRFGEDAVCHFDPATAEWDPESASFVANVVFLAWRFIQEFHRLQKGKALTEADLEFAVHWNGHCCYLDIPESKWLPNKDARLECLEFTSPETGRTHAIYRLAGQCGPNRYSEFDDLRSVQLVPVVYVDLLEHPGPTRHGWPPENLADLNYFLHQHYPRTGKCFWRNLAYAMTDKKAALAIALVIIETKAGRFGALVDGGKGGLRGFRRKTLPEWLRKNNQLTRRIRVTRCTFHRIDEDSILGRNQPESQIPLAGLNIHLIGLGAVGSILAEHLVQAGAGSSEGALHLFDFDELRPENLSRHLLGVPYLGLGKAEGVARFLRRNRLATNIAVHPVCWRDASVHGTADLVIDATGVPLIGAALSNEARRIRRYAVVWPFVEGEGWIAGAFLYRGEPGEACRTCTEPWLGGAGANVLPAYAPVGRNNGCGGLFMPFRTGAAAVAAALAGELVCDWATGLSGKTYRTVRMPGAPSHVSRSRYETPQSKTGCLCDGNCSPR
jgi:hypothetical protein